MADGRDLSMEIYGEFKDHRALVELAQAMEGYVGPGFGEGRFGGHDAMAHVLEAVAQGHPIYVTREGTGEDLDPLQDVCRDYGLAYRIKVYRTDLGPAAMWTWAPGFDKVEDVPVNDDHDAVMTLEEIRRLTRQEPGLAAVGRRLAELERMDLKDVKAATSASEEVIAAVARANGEEASVRP